MACCRTVAPEALWRRDCRGEEGKQESKFEGSHRGSGKGWYWLWIESWQVEGWGGHHILYCVKTAEPTDGLCVDAEGLFEEKAESRHLRRFLLEHQ